MRRLPAPFHAGQSVVAALISVAPFADLSPRLNFSSSLDQALPQYRCRVNRTPIWRRPITVSHIGQAAFERRLTPEANTVKLP
jgi:hypothetical protein